MYNFYNRYIRHVVLSDIGILGQDALLKSKILCVGAGGLGSPVMTYLASCGVGLIGVVDFDTVDISNLNRQFMYNVFDLGKLKSFSAVSFLKKINTYVNVHAYNARLSCDNFSNIMSGYDIIVDCTDSLEAKFLISDFSMKLNLPVIHGSVFGFSGYISMFSRDTGCYRCLYKSFSYINCIGHGILGPVAGAVGAIQAIETIKYLLTINDISSFNNLFSKLLVLDFKNLNFLVLNFNKISSCLFCN